MKNAMVWIKSNWLIVVLSIVALAALPSLWFVSSGMNRKVQKEQQERVDQVYKPLTAARVNYELPLPDGTKTLTRNTEPTRPLNQWYAAQIDRVKGAMGTVTAEALRFNQSDHKLLVAGLFPRPADAQRQLKPREMAREFLLRHRGPTGGVSPMLAAINAGGPADSERMASSLLEYDRAVRDRYEQEMNAQPDEATLRKWQKELLDLRVNIARLRAVGISVFADPSIFPRLADVPEEPSLAAAWDLQMKYWIHTDILRAVQRANAAPGGSGEGVPASVIKRIVSINVLPGPYSAEGGGGHMASPTDESAAAPADGAVPAADFRASVTGRVSAPASSNSHYDLRNVTVTVIADARRLPEFADALAATNFMTVLDADLERVDALDELKRGFYYGTSEIVRATLTIETLWLREWMKGSMPADVRRALGIGTDEADPGSPSDERIPSQPRGFPNPDERPR